MTWNSLRFENKPKWATKNVSRLCSSYKRKKPSQCFQKIRPKPCQENIKLLYCFIFIYYIILLSIPKDSSSLIIKLFSAVSKTLEKLAIITLTCWPASKQSLINEEKYTSLVIVNFSSLKPFYWKIRMSTFNVVISYRFKVLRKMW